MGEPIGLKLKQIQNSNDRNSKPFWILDFDIVYLPAVLQRCRRAKLQRKAQNDKSSFVIPAEAGIHKSQAGIYCLDPRLRGDDTVVSLCILVLPSPLTAVGLGPIPLTASAFGLGKIEN
jgi:hypothetical protein